MAKIADLRFDDVLRFDLPDDDEARDEFVREVVDCAVRSDNPAGALAEMYDRCNHTSGAVFDAFRRLYLDFDEELASIVADRAAAAGWRGPIASPCIVEATFGERDGYPYLAVPVDALISRGLTVVAMLDDDGLPERTDDGAIDWVTMPWHRIQSVDDLHFDFDPETASAEAFASEFLADAERLAVQREEARLNLAEMQLAGSSGGTTLLDELIGEDKGPKRGGDPSARGVPPSLFQGFDPFAGDGDWDGSSPPVLTPFDQVMAEMDQDIRMLRSALASGPSSQLPAALKAVRGRLNAIEALARREIQSDPSV